MKQLRKLLVHDKATAILAFVIFAPVVWWMMSMDVATISETEIVAIFIVLLVAVFGFAALSALASPTHVTDWLADKRLKDAVLSAQAGDIDSVKNLMAAASQGNWSQRGLDCFIVGPEVDRDAVEELLPTSPNRIPRSLGIMLPSGFI